MACGYAYWSKRGEAKLGKITKTVQHSLQGYAVALGKQAEEVKELTTNTIWCLQRILQR